MKKVVTLLFAILIVLTAIILAFRAHLLLGIGLIVLLIGCYAYFSRASYYAIRGSSAFAKGDLEQTLVWFKKAVSCKPCPEKHRISYGFLLMRTGDARQAEHVLEQLAQATGNSEIRAQAQCNLATAYWLQGERDRAITLLERVIGEYKNTLVYGNLGYFRILRGDLEEALSFNLEAYEYNSDDKTILDNVALNYLLLGQLDRAEEMFRKLMPQSPKYAETYYYYSLTLKQLGKTEEAVEQINLALERELSFVTPVTREQIEQEASYWTNSERIQEG